jgi:6-phosphogluconolactonase (cycloisomerase 2 family)
MLLSLGSPVSMSTDPSGQFVYAWQQQIEDDDVGVVGENGLSAYRVNRSTGALTEVPGSPLKTTQARVASAMVFAPTGLAFTRETSAIGVYRMDAATGMLAEQPGSPYALKAIPVAVTPNGKWLIAASQADSTIDTFSIDRVSGALTLHASSKLTGHVSANALLATNGSTVFVSVGDPMLDQTFGVDAFAVAGDGGVSLANSTPLEHSSQIALSADGNVLYAVSSFDISAFHVNAADGTLALIGSPGPYDPVGPISAPVVSGNELFVSEFFQVRSFALDPATGSIGGNTIAADTPSSASWLAVVK